MNFKAYLKGLGVGIIVTAVVLIISNKFNNQMSDDDVIKRAKELGYVESTTLTAPVPLGSDKTEEVSNVKDSDKENQNTTDDKNTATDDKNNSDDNNVSDDKNNVTDNKDNQNKADNNTVSDDKTVDNKDTKSDDKASQDDKTVTDNKADQTDKASTDDKNQNDDKSTDNSTDNSTDKNTSDNKTTTDNKTIDPNAKTVVVEIKSGQSSETVSASVKEAGLADDDIEFNKYLCANGYDKRLRVGQHDIPEGADFETIAKCLCGEQ